MGRFKGWTPEAVAEHRHAQAMVRYRDARWPLPPVPVVGEANAQDKPRYAVDKTGGIPTLTESVAPSPTGRTAASPSAAPARPTRYAVDKTGDIPTLRDVVAPAPGPRGFGLYLPFPPTANTYIRHTSSGRHYMTAEGRAFRKIVLSAVRRSKARKVEGRLEVIVTLCPKNRKKGDIDNRIKPLLDAMQAAKCFDNDEQVDRLEVRRDWNAKTGDCFVTVREYRP